MDALMAMALQRLWAKKEAAETMRREEEEEEGKRGSGKERKRRILEVPSRALSCRLGPKAGPEALGRRNNIFTGARLAAFGSKSLGKRVAKPWPLGKWIQARFRLYQISCGAAHVDRVFLGNRRRV